MVGQPLPPFPPCSPGPNAAMEKAWRFMHARILLRASEIKGEADHKRVIEEEWDRLAFDDSQKEDGWEGINFWVDHFGKTCDAVIDAKGYDTQYMR